MTGPDGGGDGDGWVTCDLGHRHWGLFGAAGLLLHRDGGREVLLQHRAGWSHHGGTWGLLGGARHSDETAVAAAVREAGEEGSIAAADVSVTGRFDDDHGSWTYATVVAAAGAATRARASGGESIDVAWVPVGQVDALPLHPGFAGSWPLLRGAVASLTVVVDAANVVGSRPDGWWRDRVGAARRLVSQVVATAATGVPGSDLAVALPHRALTRCWPQWVVVVEGAARQVAGDDPPGDRPGRVRVVAAEGSGDDAAVAVAAVAAEEGGPVLVVTADRELRSRVAALGAASVGPRWLTDRAGGSAPG